MDYKTNEEFFDWLMWYEEECLETSEEAKKPYLKSSKKQGGKENERN